MGSRQATLTRFVVFMLVFHLGSPGTALARQPVRGGQQEAQQGAQEEESKVPVEQAYAQHPDPLFRHVSYPAAWNAAQKSNRPLLLFVTMSGCPYCVKMVQNTLKDPDIRSLVADSFETVYVDRSAQAKLVEKLNIRYYPTIILVSSNNRVLDVIEGYVEPKVFQHRMRTNLAAFQTTLAKTR